MMLYLIMKVIYIFMMIFCLSQLLINSSSFNSDGIVYDNSPWRPGRDMDLVDKPIAEDDERKLKSLATRIMSNGVEVLVKDKNPDPVKLEQRKIKLLSTLKPLHVTSSLPNQSLLSSAVETVVNRQQINPIYPMPQLVQHNYIIKTCLTTFTYLTTLVHNKRSAISTFETIVSVVTTESLTNLYATDLIADIKPTKTKFMDVKTIHPSSASNNYQNPPKIDKRIDDNIEKDHSYFDLIQPSEVGHLPCTTSCSCSHTKTEGLNTKYNKIPAKATKYSAVKLDVKPTSIDKKTRYGPYEFESSSNSAPVDKIVEKYTEVINDYSDEKDSSSVEQSELLTNEQAPSPSKTNKVPVVKSPEKTKPEKPQKPYNKNKFVVADLLKLGSMGIKGLSQLAPVFEKMTGNFIKRQDNRTSTTTTSTAKPVTKITPYVVNKRIDSESNFPIYIPVDEMETSESQQVFSNATLHQSLASWADYKHPKSHNIKPPKMIHESPLVNGGIPISPGEIITANSDVIVGKPAVGGPLTLAASGIRLQNPVNPPSLDSLVSSNEQYVVKEKPPGEQAMISTKVDDSYDLRPPGLPKPKQKQNHYIPRPNPPTYHHEQNNHGQTFKHHNPPKNMPARPHPMPHPSDNMMKTEQIKTTALLGNHGRPAFLDYIPSFGKPENNASPLHQSVDFKPSEDGPEVLDNSPSSSEFIDTRVKTNGEVIMNGQQLPESINKPFLVDIQPSRVANVLIPHGSTTALVFAGSSEPHKTGDYVDDPLPYPEPGYFGSFSIDAPQLTNVHNVPPGSRPSQVKPNIPPPLEPYTPIKDPGLYKNEVQQKWKETKRPIDYSKLPPPTSNQETHLQIGPQITVYNPEIYKPGSNGKFEKYNNKYNKDIKDVIDKEYENYLAVPPPPPPKKQFHENNNYAQKPIVHQKPIQDMKVFLNIQHPVPKQPNVMNQDKQPTKVTSEIYFASQTPQNTHTPTYTVHIPNAANQAQNNYFSQATNRPINNVAPQYQLHKPHAEDSLKVMSSPPVVHNKPGVVNDVNVYEDNMYTVTLNTATNVANNIGETGQIVGSSVPVSVGINTVNTDVPIGTNFAIKVEDRPSSFESYNIPAQGNRSPQVIYEHHGQEPVKISVGDTRWNTTEVTAAPKIELSTNTIKYHSTTPAYTEISKPFSRGTLKPSYVPSINSHANFPMVNEQTTVSNQNVRPVTEIIDDIKPDTKRPAKLIPNIPTNSHGWYSSVPNQDYNSINNIKLDATTRKAIPLLFEYTHDSLKPDFGQKISSVGKPPSEFWVQNSDGLQSDVHKLFNQPTETEKPFSRPQITVKPSNTNYLPHNLGAIRQPVYDIPVRDNSDETTTARARPTTENKHVYEDSHEIYDGEEEIDDDSDGEESSESMKVPVVSASVENDNKKEESKSPEITLLQDETIQTPNQPENNKSPNEFVEFPGSQTEKPFDVESYNKSNIFQSNAMKPIYESNSQMKPRPFNSVSTATTLDHQMHQPHWQINEMLANSSNMSYEDNIELNIGEEISTVSTSKITPTKKIPSRYHEIDGKYRKPQRPVFSVRPNYSNDSNIITSTVHIKDKKPLTVMNENRDKTTLPTFTISSSNYDLNRSSSEIIDLSPPPPTMDYFRPSNTDEMIMGMSPPPPVNSVPSMRPLPPSRSTPRPVLPIRTPPPYRTKPPRTQPPRATTQRPTRKPITRDEVSTYRPAYDMNNIRRPTFNRDQPSSQLLPPPRDLPSRVIPINDKPSAAPSIPNIVFPTPISSGWMTSSGVNFDFAPTPIQFPEVSSDMPQLPERVSTEDSFSYYPVPSSSERDPDYSSEKPSQEVYFNSKEKISTEGSEKPATSSEESTYNVSDNIPSETSQEDTTTDKLKVVPLKNRTRKPYPVRNDDKKSSTIKYKVPSKPTPIIRPTKTIRPELYPTRHVSTKKIVRPLPTRSSSVARPSVASIIESSSESSIESDLIEPSEVLKDSQMQSENSEKSIASQKTPELESSILQNQIHLPPVVKPTHHAGNEVKISDEIVPTKTEFRTTVITLTKTLSEPPMTVSSIGYVNLTHTLTVTHTKTSLVSQSEGAVTQTLILTNTHTSTLVDVVTEIRTQVQPTTIIETVTKHIPVQIEATPVQETPTKTKMSLDDVTMSSEENENLIIRDSETTENIQKIDQENEGESDSFFVVMNKSQNGGQTPPINSDIETSDYDITRNEQVNNNGVSQVLFGEILLAGTPYLETTNVVNPNGAGFSKDCQPDCKASRNERCQRIDGMMKCVCRPGFARMFPDRPCKPTYTYSVKLALSTQGKERLQYHENLADNSSNHYNSLALATHEGINRMVMQSDLRDVYHGVHITGFHPIEVKSLDGESYQGVMNDFYVQLSDNAHESRLKEVIEKYLRNNNYSLGGTDVFAASEFMDRLNVSDFDECRSGQFHDCSEHAQCFNLRGTYTCSCLEGFADLSVNSLYPGRICSAEPVGCERCNYHGACYSRDDRRVLCECFQWYAGSTCHINLKVVLISLVTVGALLTIVLVICAVVACSKRPRPPPSRSIVTCIQNMPRTLHQGGQPSKQRADRRALITERADSGDASSIQNASLPYMPAKKQSSSSKKMMISDPPSHEPPPPPPPAVMIPRAKLHPPHRDSREMASRKESLELSSQEAKLISYLESGATVTNEEMMRRKHSMESSYSAPKDRHTMNKQGALVSAGFKVSTTIRPDESMMKDDDMSSVNKNDLEAELRFDSLRKSYSQEDISEWTDAERRIGELTLSEARSIGGTLPASTGRAASSTRLTHQEANTMAERDLGSTFLLPHVHLYKPDITSDVSEFDSL